MTRFIQVFILSAVVLLSTPVAAEEGYQVQMKGNVWFVSYQNAFEAFRPMLTTSRIEIDVGFKQGIPLTEDPSGSFSIENNIHSLALRLFYSDNFPVTIPIDMTRLGASGTLLSPETPLSPRGFSFFGVIESDFRVIVEIMDNDSFSPLFEVLNESDWRLTDLIDAPTASLSIVTTEGADVIRLFFSLHTLNITISDADGDGIADADDQCATTIAFDTVWFDGVNSGVTNHVDANGCAISDHYASCDAEQPSSSLFSYSGPTQCEMLMGYQLYREGLIDYTELRMLRNAL